MGHRLHRAGHRCPQHLDAFDLCVCVPARAVCRHIPRLHDYLWLAEDGMKMQGYNGSHLWDTAFTVQAIAASGLASDFQRCLQRAHAYLDTTQVSC